MENARNQSVMNVGELMEAWEEEQEGTLPLNDPKFQEQLSDELLNPKSLVIKVLLAIGAWFGAVLFIGFLALMHLVSSEESLLITGLIFIAAYLATSYRPISHPLLEPFTLAIGMIGQVMAGIALIDIYRSPTPLAIIGLVIEGVLLRFSNSSIQRFASTILLLLCILLLVNDSQIYLLIHLVIGGCGILLLYLWTNEASLLSKNRIWAVLLEPVGLGLTAGLGLLLLLTVNKDFYAEVLVIPYWWLSTAFIGGCLLYAVWQLLDYYQVQHARLPVMAGLLVILAPTLLAPGIAYALLVVVLGFFRKQRILLGWGIISLICFVTFFYYNINISLLWKSMALVASGLALLGARWLAMKAMVKEDKSIPTQK